MIMLGLKMNIYTHQQRGAEIIKAREHRQHRQPRAACDTVKAVEHQQDLVMCLMQQS